MIGKLAKGKRQRKRPHNIYSPMKMTKELQKIGEGYSKKEAILIYGAVALMAFALGLLYQLRPICIVLCIVSYLFMVPQLMINWKKNRYEKKRFDDANAYMAQMAQSFTSNKVILTALQETMQTFPEGRMHDTLESSIKYINNHSFQNVRETKKEALESISRKYDCERIRNLHEFLLKAEERGGNCETEFQLLERIREVWERAVLGYYKTMVMARALVTVEYFVLMLVCVFLLGQFPNELSIIGTSLVQVLNTMQVIFLLIVFKAMDKKLTASLLTSPKNMTQEKVDRAFAYIDGFNAKAEKKKNVPVLVLAVILFTLLFFMKPSTGIVTVGIVLIVIILNMHNLSFQLTLMQLKTEIKKAFPKWLFDMLLLIQSESVDVALFKSIENTPPVLKGELKRIQDALKKNPSSADAYMSFLARYQVPGVENAMRKLYSLSAGTGGKGEVMNVIIDSNMTLLAEAEKNSIKNKGDMSSVYAFVPVIPIVVSMIGYMIMLLITVFQQVMTFI